MKKPAGPVKVVNINKNGEVFNPSGYTVSRETCPELFNILTRGFHPIAPIPIDEDKSFFIDFEREGKPCLAYFKIRGMGTYMHYAGYDENNHVIIAPIGDRIANREFSEAECEEYIRLLWNLERKENGRP